MYSISIPSHTPTEKKGEDIDNHIATAEHFIGIGWEPVIDANFSAGTNTKKALLIPVLKLAPIGIMVPVLTLEPTFFDIS